MVTGLWCDGQDCVILTSAAQLCHKTLLTGSPNTARLSQQNHILNCAQPQQILRARDCCQHCSVVAVLQDCTSSWDNRATATSPAPVVSSSVSSTAATLLCSHGPHCRGHGPDLQLPPGREAEAGAQQGIRQNKPLLDKFSAIIMFQYFHVYIRPGLCDGTPGLPAATFPLLWSAALCAVHPCERGHGVPGGAAGRDAGDVVDGPHRPLVHHQQLRRPQRLHHHRGETPSLSAGLSTVLLYARSPCDADRTRFRKAWYPFGKGSLVKSTRFETRQLFIGRFAFERD